MFCPGYVQDDIEERLQISRKHIWSSLWMIQVGKAERTDHCESWKRQTYEGVKRRKWRRLLFTLISYHAKYAHFGSRVGAVGIASGYGLDDRGLSSSPGRVKNFLFFTSSRPTLESTQPPIQWVPGDLSPGVKRPGRDLTTHLQLVPRLRKCGSILRLPHTPSWRNA
jgi:hypothetical protein